MIDLVGRVDELGLLRDFLADAAVDGGALLLSSEPGLGKTALLDAAVDSASGARLLRAAGAEFETDVSFAGLHQLLLPVWDEFGALGTAHRAALRVALGFGDGPRPDRLVVCNATLELLRHTATEVPLLVVVDDLQWLDRSSAAVLGFVARRLAGSRVGYLAATRSGDGATEHAGIPTLELRPLDDTAAEHLVGARFPTLAPEVLGRVVAEAQGNPLALVELPTSLSGAQQAASEALPAVLPLTRRLQALFTERVANLPPATRRFLLVAALEGTGDIRTLRAATGDGMLDDLAPAEASRVVSLDAGARRVTFHHPLIRSAVVALASAAERRAAHRALADAPTDQPGRRAWHLAEATVEPDETVAVLLDDEAHRVLRRGDTAGAVTALTRAATLSPADTDRSRRLAEAAYIGANSGAMGTASELLAAARQADPAFGGSLHDASTAAYLLVNGDGDVDTAHRLLVAAIESYPGRTDAGDEALLEAINTLFVVCLFGGRAELWQPFHAAVARLSPAAPEELVLRSGIFAEPVLATPAMLDRLDAAIEGLRDDTDPIKVVRTTISATYVDRLSGGREALWRIVRQAPGTGSLTVEGNALRDLCLDDFGTGKWDEAMRLADRGAALAEVHGSGLVAWQFQYVHALLAAVRGDVDANRALTEDLIGWAGPRGAVGARHFALHARTLAAIGQGDFADAYRSAVAISPIGEVVPHVGVALWVCLDLVEAAVRTDRAAEAAAHVTALHAAGVADLSPRLALLVAGAAAVAAPDDLAGDLFDAALALPGIDRRPFDLARVHLAYGEHLRRTRATARSRAHLGTALDIFQRLGATPWATRAGSELRATGQTRLTGDEQASLTPQELEIATLAASGLSNKQIAERLYLSHRTVGNHLHRVFPKLGVTSRAGLRDALG